MHRLILATIVCACGFIPLHAQSPFSGLKPRVPSDANTLILINAEKMFGSPVADRDRWNARRKAAYDSGVSALPPDATQVVLAGRTDHEFGKPIWQLSLMKLREDRNVATVATRFGGEIDNISGRSAVRLPSDHYVVQVTKNIMGAYMPANRQDVSRWLKRTDTIGDDDLPPYLLKAFEYANEVGTPIVMAMDLSGQVSEAEIKRKLESNDIVKKSGLSPDQLAKLISGTQGITLGITLQDNTVGAIRVDFSDSPEILADIGKPILIEVLRNQGAMIEEIHDWTPSISGNTFLLRGTLTPTGTRRVMSVLELPRSLADSLVLAKSSGSDSDESATRIAAQQYYQSVTSMIEDLREKPKRDHVQTFGQAAMWYDKYARKIDHLPILNVDEALVNYGVNIAGLFREAEAAMKGVGMRATAGTRGNNPTSGGYSTTLGGYRAGMGAQGDLYGSPGVTIGVGPGRASLQAKGQSDANIRGRARQQGAATVQQIWQTIDETTAAVRRDMTNKYQVEF